MFTSRGLMAIWLFLQFDSPNCSSIEYKATCQSNDLDVYLKGYLEYTVLAHI